MLINGDSRTEPGKDTNSMTNKTVLVQKKVLDHLLILGVESQWAPVVVRCAALRSIGDLIAHHPKNIDALASKVLGEEPQVELALNSILRIILRTSSVQEFVAADCVFKNFCEKNPDGQRMLASTLIPQPESMTNAPPEEDVNMSFGSMLLHGLTMSENDGDVEICGRAASVLSHLLKDNEQCKERALKIELEAPAQSIGPPEPLMHRMVKYLAFVSSLASKDGKPNGKGSLCVQEMILKLLIIWLVEYPSAVQCFLDARPHLTCLIELVSNESVTVCISGMAAVVLGECVLYNKCVESGKDAFAIVDAISQKIGLTSYFLKFDEMQKGFLFSCRKLPEQRKSLSRSSAASMADIEEDGTYVVDKRNEDNPILVSLFDVGFVTLVSNLEANIREKFVEVYSNPKAKVAVVPAELEQRSGESDGDYIDRLRSFVEKQCSEIQDLLVRNASLAEDLAKTGVKVEQRTSGPSERAQIEYLRRELHEASQRLEVLKAEKAKIESDASMYCNLAGKMESDLKSLSDAYNSLEQANLQLEKEVQTLRDGGYPDIEAIKSQVREEALKESEAELNDLLVCLGQEQSKVERLTERLLALGENVDELLEGIGDETGLPEDDEGED